MKKAAAIVTNRGGRTCHAAIVSRELGLPAVVGTENGTDVLKDGMVVTVSCAEGDTGVVYNGALHFQVERVLLDAVPRPATKVMLNVGNPVSMRTCSVDDATSRAKRTRCPDSVVPHVTMIPAIVRASPWNVAPCTRSAPRWDSPI